MNTEIPKYKPEVIKQIIIEEATRQGVPVELALAVAEQESGFNNKAVSKANADGSRDHGVMQLNDKYHKLKNVYDPFENIRYGVGMLAEGLKRNNGNVQKTLSDYNAGANAKGKGRQQGDAYALKVMTLANRNKNRGIASNNAPTGAAAPVSDISVDIADVVGDLTQAGLAQGEQIVDKYIKNSGYDTKKFEELRARKNDETKKALDEIKSLSTKASPEDVKAITDRYTQAKQDMKDLYATAISGIQSGIGADKIDNYYNRLAQADEARLKRMQEANPYTRMAQMAPLDLDDYARAVNRQQQTNAMIRANNIAMGLPAGEVNFANEAQQLAQARQAAQMARQTGLTPEQFIEGGLLDYKNMGTTFNNQQQVMANLVQAAYQGDRQAQQMLANMYTGMGTNMANLASQEQRAIQQANADELARAQLASENTRWATTQGQNLDPLAVQAEAANQQARLNNAVSTINQNAQMGANAANNYLNYIGMMQKAAAQNQPEVQDPYKAVKDFNTMRLNALGMSPNVTPQMLQEAVNEARSQFGLTNPNAAAILDPYRFQNNYSQFDTTGRNTFGNQQ